MSKVKLEKRKLESLIRDNPQLVERVLAETVFESESEIKENVPVDTGTLKNSVNSRPLENNLWRIGDGVNYGIYIEYGTSRMAARPTFRPALNKAETKLKKRLEDEYNKV